MDLKKTHPVPSAAAKSAGFADFGDVVERYQSLVWAVAYATIGDPALSDDVAQETFLAAWKQQADIRDPGKIRGYLASIARNLGRKSLRRVGRELVEGYVIEGDSEAVDARSPLDDLLKREQLSQLGVALGQMPVSSREAFVLFYAGGQSVERVAIDLDLSQSAVKQRLYRARESLKDSLHKTLSEAVVRGKPGKALRVATMALILRQSASAGAATAHATMAHASGCETAAKGQGLFASTIGAASGKAVAGLVLVACVAVVAYLSSASMTAGTTSEFSEAPTTEPGPPESGQDLSVLTHSALRNRRFASAQVRLPARTAGADAKQRIASRIQEHLPDADIDGDGQLSEDEVVVLRDSQEDELTREILAHWQDKPYGVTCVFVEPGDDGQVQEGWTPYNLYGLRTLYEQGLEAGLSMDAEQWLSSRVASAQGERICYEIVTRYHDEVHELRANAKGEPLPWVASVRFEHREPLLFLPPGELSKELASVADQSEADEVASRWGVQLLVLAKDSVQAVKNEPRYIAVSRNQSEVAEWGQLPPVIRAAIESAGSEGLPPHSRGPH